MRGRTLMFWVAAAALVAAAGYLLFTGGDGNRVVPGTEITLAADRTTGKGTSHIAMSMTMATNVNGQDVSLDMHGTGDIDIKRQLAQLSLEMSPPAGVDLGTDDFTIDEVMADYVIYMRSPLFASGLPAGKQWMSIDLNEVGKELGFDFQQLSGIGSNSDPSEMLRQLRAVSGQVDEVGEEDVGGVPTTHYVATIDLKRYVALAKPSERAAVNASIQRLIELGAPSSMPVNVWVDGQHLVRRMQMSYTQDDPTTGTPVDITMDIELSDFGEPVNVQVPSPAETIDAQDLLGSSYGSAIQGSAP